MLPPTRTGPPGPLLLIDELATAPILTGRVHLHAPTGSLQRVLPARQPGLFDLVERALGDPAACRGGADDGHRRRGRRRFPTHPMADEDRAAVRVNREAEQRKGHLLTATRWRVLIDRRAALPARLERPWILYPPTTEALRFGHAPVAEASAGSVRSRSVCCAATYTRRACTCVRVTMATRAAPGTTTTSPSAASMTRPLAVGRGLRVGTRHGDCGHEHESDRHEPSAGHMNLPDEQGAGRFPCQASILPCQGTGSVFRNRSIAAIRSGPSASAGSL